MHNTSCGTTPCYASMLSGKHCISCRLTQDVLDGPSAMADEKLCWAADMLTAQALWGHPAVCMPAFRSPCPSGQVLSMVILTV
jgi:hypothetical protein